MAVPFLYSHIYPKCKWFYMALNYSIEISRDALMVETSNRTKSKRQWGWEKEHAGSSWESVCFRYFSAVMKSWIITVCTTRRLYIFVCLYVCVCVCDCVSRWKTGLSCNVLLFYINHRWGLLLPVRRHLVLNIFIEINSTSDCKKRDFCNTPPSGLWPFVCVWIVCVCVCRQLNVF